MNAEGRKVWKKLAKKDLIMGPRVAGQELHNDAQDMINDLKDKLDCEYTVQDIKHLTDPATFEPITIIQLIKTK